MVFKRNDFTKKADFKKSNFLKEKTKGSRLTILALFLGTGFLSGLFWLKNNSGDWQEKLNKPFIYKIIGRKDNELSKALGIKPDLRDFEGIKKTINLLIKDLTGDYSFYFLQLKTKASSGIKENQVFEAASVNKIPVMVSFYQQVEKGGIEEDGKYVLKKEDIQDYGSGSIRYQEPGVKYKYSDLIKLIGKESDNTASYVIINLIGQDEIQGGLDKLGFEKTSIKENTTTSKEMGDYLNKFYENELVSEKSKDKILNSLIDTDFEDRIPQGIPENIQTAHKIGNDVQIYNDCGIILSSDPYVLCILTNGVVEEEALDIIPKISRLIWEYNKSL